jgi:hypothetical protein
MADHSGMDNLLPQDTAGAVEETDREVGEGCNLKWK